MNGVRLARKLRQQTANLHFKLPLNGGSVLRCATGVTRSLHVPTPALRAQVSEVLTRTNATIRLMVPMTSSTSGATTKVALTSLPNSMGVKHECA